MNAMINAYAYKAISPQLFRSANNFVGLLSMCCIILLAATRAMAVPMVETSIILDDGVNPPEIIIDTYVTVIPPVDPWYELSAINTGTDPNLSMKVTVSAPDISINWNIPPGSGQKLKFYSAYDLKQYSYGDPTVWTSSLLRIPDTSATVFLFILGLGSLFQLRNRMTTMCKY